jgi:hypothetical protein
VGPARSQVLGRWGTQDSGPPHPVRFVGGVSAALKPFFYHAHLGTSFDGGHPEAVVEACGWLVCLCIPIARLLFQIRRFTIFFVCYPGKKYIRVPARTRLQIPGLGT